MTNIGNLKTHKINLSLGRIQHLLFTASTSANDAIVSFLLLLTNSISMMPCRWESLFLSIDRALRQRVNTPPIITKLINWLWNSDEKKTKTNIFRFVIADDTYSLVHWIEWNNYRFAIVMIAISSAFRSNNICLRLHTARVQSHSHTFSIFLFFTVSDVVFTVRPSSIHMHRIEFALRPRSVK